MKTRPVITLSICGCIAVLAILWLYFTQIYYYRTFDICVRNETTQELRKLTIQMSPEGTFDLRFLMPGIAMRYMDTPWPVPTQVTVVFEDAARTRQSVTVVTHLEPKFRGEITIGLTQTNGGFAAECHAVRRDGE